MPGNESNHSQSEEQPFKVLEQIELIAKASAGVVALTYVSGYLIETTYLGSFGVHAEAIEFFRAKYLYIGFHYWFSIAMFSVLLILIKRIVEFIRACRHHQNIEGQPELTQHDFDVKPELTPEERKEVKNVLERKLPPREAFLRPSFGELRWTFVVCAIIMVFSLQILFIDPRDPPKILPLQFIFLFTVALHQATHYREYYSYWGILHGRAHVGLQRLLAAVVELLLACWIFYRLSPFQHLYDKPTCFLNIYLAIGAVFVLIASSTLFPLLFHYKQMAWFDCSPEENLLTRGKAPMLKRFIRATIGGGKVDKWSKLRFLWSAILCLITAGLLFDALCLAEGIDKSQLRYGFIGALALILALFVPFNIIFLTVVRKDMYRRLNILPEKKSSTNQYSALILQVIPMTVLYLVSVLAFSHTIYPRIPEEKAGGSYVNTRQAKLHYITHTTADNCLLNPTEDRELMDGEYLVLTEDANWIYIADLKEQTDHEKRNMPEDWRKSLLETRALIRPVTHAVSRNCIEYITYPLPNSNSK